MKKFVRQSVCLEHSKGEEAWGEKVEGIIKEGLFIYVLLQKTHFTAPRKKEIIHEHIQKNELHEHHKICSKKGPKPVKNPSIRVN